MTTHRPTDPSPPTAIDPGGFDPAPDTPKVFPVTVERHAGGWRVQVEGVGGVAGVQARDLADVEPRVRKLVWSLTGRDPADIQLDVDVCLPSAIQLRLQLAEELCDEATREVDMAIKELIEAGLSVRDVGVVLRDRYRAPRPVSVTNEEIARHGLSRHPDALGVCWDDGGRFRTVTCRDCVEDARRDYLDLPPDDESVIVYDGPLHCEHCNQPSHSPAS